MNDAELPEDGGLPPPPGGDGGAEVPAGVTGGPDGPAGAEGAPGGRARTYAARRRGWIGEHSRDDRFLIFVGVAVLLAVLFLVAYKVFEDWRSKESHGPVSLVELFRGEAEEPEPGLLRVAYDFRIDPEIAFLRDACPQVGDWSITGTVDNQGILFSADNRYRPFFDGGDISVECDAAIAFGSKVAIDLGSIYDEEEGDFYRFELTASLGEGWPPTAQIVRFREGGRSSSPSASLPELKVSRRPRDPPTFYRIRFEQSGDRLRGYFARSGEKLKKVCEIKAGKLTVGTVALRGPGSQTAFDNVVITGRPHPKLIEKRTELYYLFEMHKKGDGAGYDAVESGPPLAEPESTPPAAAEN
jgi:hypothetical protein